MALAVNSITLLLDSTTITSTTAGWKPDNGILVITSKSVSAEVFAGVSPRRLSISSSNFVTTRMRVRAPTLALHRRCRVPTRMEAEVESVSHLRGSG
jgi:hypothetical protein